MIHENRKIDYMLGGMLPLQVLLSIIGVYPAFNIIVFFAILFLLIVRAKSVPEGVFGRQGLYYSYLLYILFYCISLAVHLSSAKHSRVFASLYDLSAFASIFLVIYLLRGVDFSRLPFFKWSIIGFQSLILPLLITMYIIFWSAHPKKPVTLPTLFGTALGHLPFHQLKQLSSILIVKGTWFAHGVRPRTSFIFPYPNAFAGILLMLFVIGIAMSTITRDRLWKWISWISLVAGMVAALSRITFIAMFLMLIVKFLFVFWRKFGKKTFLSLVLVLVLVSAASLIFGIDKVLWHDLNSLRSGSSKTRFALYQATAHLIFSHMFLGLGYRPIWSVYPIPIGSHDTYLGVLIYSGVLGFIAFISFIGLVIRKWYLAYRESHSPYLVSAGEWLMSGFLGSLVFMVAEDIQGVGLLAVLWAVVISLLLSFHNSKAVPTTFDGN